MGIGTDRQERLIALIERWLAGGGSRNFNMLARLTAVSAPTIRRILQKETIPELETVLCLLNIVASPDEAMEVLGNSPALANYIKRISSVPGEFKSEAAKDAADEVGVQLSNRERFWCYSVALVTGVTREFIEKLCGAYGVFELEKMVDEKILYERAPGRFYPTHNQEGAVVKNKAAYSAAVCHIAEVGQVTKNAQKLFMVGNTTAEVIIKIKEKNLITFSECVELVQANPGDIVIASSIVNTTVLGEGSEV